MPSKLLLHAYLQSANAATALHRCRSGSSTSYTSGPDNPTEHHCHCLPAPCHQLVYTLQSFPNRKRCPGPRLLNSLIRDPDWVIWGPAAERRAYRHTDGSNCVMLFHYVHNPTHTLPLGSLQGGGTCTVANPLQHSLKPWPYGRPTIQYAICR